MTDEELFKAVKQTIRLAINKGYEDWLAGQCRETECGCVTEYVKNRVYQSLDALLKSIAE